MLITRAVDIYFYSGLIDSVVLLCYLLSNVRLPSMLTSMYYVKLLHLSLTVVRTVCSIQLTSSSG